MSDNESVDSYVEVESWNPSVLEKNESVGRKEINEEEMLSCSGLGAVHGQLVADVEKKMRERGSRRKWVGFGVVVVALWVGALEEEAVEVREPPKTCVSDDAPEWCQKLIHTGPVKEVRGLWKNGGGGDITQIEQTGYTVTCINEIQDWSPAVGHLLSDNSLVFESGLMFVRGEVGNDTITFTNGCSWLRVSDDGAAH